LNRRGYTLIELVLLTIIIVILVGISTPLFRRTFTDLEIKDASYNMARLIGFAQEKAVMEAIPYRLILDQEESSYYLTKSDQKDPEKYIRLKEKFGKRFLMPRGITLKADKKKITFYPDGHSDKALIRLIGKKGALKIDVKGTLGHVEIDETEQ